MFVSATTYLDALFLLLGDNSDRSRALVKDFITVVDRDAGKKEVFSADEDLVDVYKHLIKTVIAEKITTAVDDREEDMSAAKMLLLKVKSNEKLNNYPVIRDILTDVLSKPNSISANQIDQYLQNLRNSLLLADMDEMNRKVFARTKRAADISDPEDMAAELANIKAMFEDTLKSIEQKASQADHQVSESYVSLSDEESVSRALEIYMERSVAGVVKPGLQGMTRALGERGGMGLGETAVFAAPSHHFKSGMMILWMIWCVIYNKYKPKSGKRPLVYFVSLENEVNKNLISMFKTLYGSVERKKVHMEDWTVESITKWLTTYFAQFDVELIIDRYTPHEFSYSKYIKRYNALSEMFEVVVFVLDYMSEAKGIDPGDTMSSQGTIQLIKENYLKFVNHAKPCGYLLITGHQLIKAAVEKGNSTRHGVKKFTEALMADSSDVFRIVDIVAYLFIENNADGVKFLTVQFRKNRGSEDTKESDKFFAYRFTEFGIEDDLNGPPQYVTDIDAWSDGQTVRHESIVESAMF